MCRRANGQQDHAGQFRKRVPAMRKKSAFRLPAMRERLAAVEHPLPIHSLVDLGGQLPDAPVGEIAPAMQHPAEQQSGIDGRRFRLPLPLPCLPVEEMEIKTHLMFGPPGKKLESRMNAFYGLLRLQEAALMRDA